MVQWLYDIDHFSFNGTYIICWYPRWYPYYTHSSFFNPTIVKYCAWTKICIRYSNVTRTIIRYTRLANETWQLAKTMHNYYILWVSDVQNTTLKWIEEKRDFFVAACRKVMFIVFHVKFTNKTHENIKWIPLELFLIVNIFWNMYD